MGIINETQSRVCTLREQNVQRVKHVHRHPTRAISGTHRVVFERERERERCQCIYYRNGKYECRCRLGTRGHSQLTRDKSAILHA